MYRPPSPQEKFEKGPLLRFLLRGGGVCTQARFRSVLCVSVFHRSFLNFRVHVFWRGTSHPKSPRTTGNEAARVCEKRSKLHSRPQTRYKLSRVALGTRMSKLPQKFCYHGNVATHFFFLKSAVNPPHPPQERSCFPQICTCRSPKIFPDPKLSNLSPPCFFNFADFSFIPRASRSTYQLLPTWIRSVLALLFRARRTECSFNYILHWHGWLSGKLCKCCRWGFPMLYL